MTTRNLKTKTGSKHKMRLGRGVYKIAQFLFGFAATLLLAGFFVFLVLVNTAKPPTTIAKIDGIVVLTGSDGSRLMAAASLLQSGHGERMLISGVNKTVKPAQIQALLGIGDAKFACCVDLDYQAENTFDNGHETAIWARALGYENILLVTSAYHMPRAKLEINAASGEVSIIAYPVRAKTKTSIWRKTRLLIREYGKLLVSLAREPGARKGHKPLSANLAPIESTRQNNQTPKE